MLLLVTVALLLGLLGLPFTLWRQFRLEARFGFNRMTPGLFVADALRACWWRPCWGCRWPPPCCG